MIELSLTTVPNQSLSSRLDGSRYDITLKAVTGDMMAVSITRDGTAIVSGQRAVAGTPLLPYRYHEAGNFVFLTKDGAAPYYTEFGTSQALLYLTADEIEAL